MFIIYASFSNSELFPWYIEMKIIWILIALSFWTHIGAHADGSLKKSPYFAFKAA